MRLIPRLALGLALALTLVPGVRGEEPSAWLDRMELFYQRGVFATDFVLTGQFYGLTIRGTGRILYRDERRQRLDAQVGMDIPGLGEALSASIKEVRDGEYLWSEVGVGPEVEVFKERLAKADRDGPRRFSEPGRSMNPISEIRAVRQYAIFQAVEKTADMVVLRGRLLPRVLEEDAVTDLLGPDAEIRLGLRRQDAAPLLLSLGPPGAPPVATLQLQDPRRLKTGQLPAGAFSYTPPADTQVNEK